MSDNNTPPVKKLSVFSLAMINIAAVLSLRGMPTEAVYGLSSVFYYVVAAFLFFIPVALASAEMGVYVPQQKRRRLPLGGRSMGRESRIHSYIYAVGAKRHAVSVRAYAYGCGAGVYRR